MQQGRSNATMENDTHSSRSRNNSKLKVLVRSHAMREEASPPRVPSPSCPHHQLQQPRIELTPSPEPLAAQPLQAVTTTTTSPVQCCSPASTLVASPVSRCSPLCASNDVELNSPQSPGSDHSSHSSIRKKYCECHHPNCIKCGVQHRNFNNNLASLGGKGMPGSPNRLSVSRAGPKGKLRQQSSSQSSFEISSTTSPSLSRDNSAEQYTDTTGVDLEQFIPETLNRNAKDRALMLRIEQELVILAKDKNKTHYKFPPMSSYQRMLVHRCAAYFGMDHNIEPSGKCVVVNKTKNTRIPEVEFKEHIKEDIVFSEEPRRSILKRDSNSIEDYSFKSPDRSFSLESRRSKSFEEREEEYEKVRRRIFNREMQNCSAEDFVWAERTWSSTDSDYSSTKFRLQPPDLHSRHNRKLLKVQSEEVGETNRPYVAKSYSFGGYAGHPSVLNRGDSVMSTHSAGPRLLTKQDSGASSCKSWRLSPSSSGYKSQSQMSESITPSPTSTPHPMGDSRQDSNSSAETQDSVIMERSENHIIWAVTDIHNVPKGSVIINPQTGKPIKNNDGSIYHYDPTNPPPGMTRTAPSKSPPSPTKIVPKEHQTPPKTKCSAKTSPIRKLNVTNTATSPSLPFSPPLSVSSIKSYSQGPQEDNPPSIQHFPIYNSSHPSSTAESNIPIYQPPCLFYTSPYGALPMQQQYDGRMDQHPPLPDIPSTYFIQESTGPPPAPSITYQQQAAPFWNQQPLPFFQNTTPQNPTPPQRFPVPLQTAQSQAGYIQATTFPSNYLQQPATVPAQNTAELIPVFPNQALQMVYNQASVPNAVLYQNQPPVLYAHNAVFSSPTYPPQNPVANVPAPYPQATQTPNGCTSAIPSQQFSAAEQAQNFVQLTQSVQQLNLAHQGQGNMQRAFLGSKCQQPCEVRSRSSFPKRNSFATPPKSFIMGSSQSSTATSSPAATIIPGGYCPPNMGLYKTPPTTPPATQFAGFPLNFNIPSLLFRQISNTSVSTSRTSRSPTPANDFSQVEKQHMSLPPNVYQGTPYVIQSDTRVFAGRGQPSTYRQPTPPSKQAQATDLRSHGKSRATN